MTSSQTNLVPRSTDGKEMTVGVHLELSSLVRRTTPPFSTLATKAVEDPTSSPITDGVMSMFLRRVDTRY